MVSLKPVVSLRPVLPTIKPHLFHKLLVTYPFLQRYQIILLGERYMGMNNLRKIVAPHAQQQYEDPRPLDRGFDVLLSRHETVHKPGVIQWKPFPFSL